MGFIDPDLAALNKFVSLGNRFDARFVIHDLTLPRVLRPASPEVGAKFADALLAVLPPWEGEEILLPLERLGYSLAFGAVVLSFPCGYEPQDREWVMEYAGRLVHMVDAELLKRQAFGHRLFADVFWDRVSAWRLCVRAVRDLSRKVLSSQLVGVLVERLLAVASYKASLLERVIEPQLREASQPSRRALACRVRDTIACGMAHPWQPVLSDDDLSKGIDIIVSTALPAADCRKLFALLQRVVSREVIVEPTLPPNFVSGLIRNTAFKGAGERLPTML
ncbi:MAG: hypothetical protein U0136_17480 [Bdellovibrionota bacterium]